jgi:hypothetical protein
MRYGNANDSYKELMAMIIWRCLEDIGTSVYTVTDRQKDDAMSFILSPDCEALCLALGVSWERIKNKAGILYQNVIAEE